VGIKKTWVDQQGNRKVLKFSGLFPLS